MARKSLRGLGAELYSPASDEPHQHTSLPVRQHTSPDESLTKATFYLSPEVLHDLDRAWIEHRGRERRRVSKSALVERALREFLTKPDPS
jgi:hypothetical protein